MKLYVTPSPASEHHFFNVSSAFSNGIVGGILMSKAAQERSKTDGCLIYNWFGFPFEDQKIPETRTARSKYCVTY